MHEVRPSRTALAAAIHRAEHQVLERGRIFADPLALRILGLRLRTPLPSGLRVFEVDHPATQAWKRQRLAEAAIPVPGALTFVPVDFERETLADGLTAAAFDVGQETFFTWLGVVPYLTQGAVWSTLGFMSGLAGGAHVVFDYSDPPDTLEAGARAVYDRRAARLAALGEKLLSSFEPTELHARLRALGFTEIEDLSPPQIVERFFPGNALPVPGRGGHVLRAVRRSAGSAP